MVNTVPERVQLGAATTNRKWYLDVQDPEVPGVWVGVFGITESKPRSAEATTQDDSDMDGEGYKSQTTTALTWGFDGKASRKTVDGAPTQYDEGQEIMRRVAETIGGVLPFRYYEMEPGGPRVIAKEGKGNVTWTEDGGNMESLDLASFSITGRGKPTNIPHPEGGTAAPVITAVSPAEAATGESIVIQGSYFSTGSTAAGYVKVGEVNAEDYTVVDSRTILATVPTGAAGSAPVSVGATEFPYTRGA
jgi:hypothetical protein